MTLQIGDIVNITGVPLNVFFVYSGPDIQTYKRIPEGDYGRFICANETGWDVQCSPCSYTTLVARPNWAHGMACVWEGFDAKVSSVKDDTAYLEWEQSHIAVPVVDLTIHNYSMFIRSKDNEEKAA
jgi:hypothetical protein